MTVGAFFIKGLSILDTNFAHGFLGLGWVDDDELNERSELSEEEDSRGGRSRNCWGMKSSQTVSPLYGSSGLVPRISRIFDLPSVC